MTTAADNDRARSRSPAGDRSRPRGGRRILFVFGLDSRCTARELAHEFERYGTVNRLDIPANGRTASTSYAFVEFVHARDAEDAYNRIHGRRFRGGTIKVEWAKKIPRVFLDEDDAERRGRRHSPSRSRSPTARDRSRSRSRSRASRSPPPRSP